MEQFVISRNLHTTQIYSIQWINKLPGKVSAENVQEGVPLSLPSLAEAILGDECARISYLRLIKSFPEIEIKSVLAEDKSIVTFLNRVRCI